MRPSSMTTMPLSMSSPLMVMRNSRRDDADFYDVVQSQVSRMLGVIEGELARARLALERRQLVAPFPGYVGLSDVEVGDRVETAEIRVGLTSPPAPVLFQRLSMPMCGKWPHVMIQKGGD